MKTLKDIQQGLQDSLIGKDQGIVDILVEPENMSVEDRLQVYQDDYYLRLFHALKDDYACVAEWLGDETFNLIIADYLEAYPSTTYTIREIGYDFPKFLNEKEAEPALIELAEFERAMIVSLFAKDAEALNLDALGKIPPDQWGDLIITLHPSVQRLMCDYNTLDYWLVHDNKKPIESKTLETPVLNLIWRKGIEAYFRALTLEQTVLITAIAEGEVFSDLCEQMLQYFSEEEVVQWVASALQMWISDGVFSGADSCQK